MTITKADLDAWREACERATAGPWRYGARAGCRAIKGGKLGRHRQAQYTMIAFTVGLQDDAQDLQNAVFIALARTALPRAIDRIEELEREAVLRHDAQTQVNGAHEHLDICGASGGASLIGRIDSLANQRAAARTRISTLEQLCREACGIARRIERDSGDWKPDDAERISAILAAVDSHDKEQP